MTGNNAALSPKMLTFLFVISLAVVASAESATEAPAKNADEARYIVFPGLDAAADEIAEWATGFASPFNVYFGPKPYIVGWIGEGGGFGDDPEIGGPDYEDEEDSYEDEDDSDDDEDDPDFDPEDFYPEKKNG